MTGAPVSQDGLSSPTEPSSTVSALTGFDPSRKSDTFQISLDLTRRRRAIDDGAEAALALEWLTEYGQNVIRGGYGDKMRGADEGKDYHDKALAEFAKRINDRAIAMAVADLEDAYASAISDATPKSGAAEGESAAPSGETPR